MAPKVKRWSGTRGKHLNQGSRAGFFCLSALIWACAARSQAPEPADAVYRYGKVYTVDAHDSVQQAIAVRGGRIVYVGPDIGVAPFLGPATRVHDLHGRMLMPGLIDGHMHPLAGDRASSNAI